MIRVKRCPAVSTKLLCIRILCIALQALYAHHYHFADVILEYLFMGVVSITRKIYIGFELILI
jgi:hypothetical protein